ncbi:AAA family ATPase [uncultured Brachyspira sp.]|uniref:AAA family ATPase n=1 Tax=uncultured Brachyspira sp. TaxID=221953 RepID=UPI0026266783|nr:AAA family ATPase [uncultured Brachyspira sp.]
MIDNIFKSEILNYASKLDAVTNSYGKIIKAAYNIVDEYDNSSTIYLINYTSKLIKSEKSSKRLKILSNALKDSIMKFYGYYYILECNNTSYKDDDVRSLEELIYDLNELVGLESVKNHINDLIAFHTVQILRDKYGLHSQKTTMHIAFTGNPGTGKTTVARIIGRIYKHIGLLSKGHFIEVSRTDLIAGYQGQTAIKVKKVIDEARGGVLFIDEAYSITENDHSDSYGRECLTELTKALEDYRNDLVVIVAGYTEPMIHFFESNPGLKSRFNTFIEFHDYTVNQLLEMFIKLCDKNDYILSDDISYFLYDIILEKTKNKNFENGRFVRNFYNNIIISHARRVMKINNPSKEELSLITYDDINMSI